MVKGLYNLSALRRFKVPGTDVQLLTTTSKMPGPSFSLPAHKSCPGSMDLVGLPGSVCSYCYASKGMYTLTSVIRAQQARMAWVTDTLRHGRPREFVDLVEDAIKATECKWFRLHDSGDFFSPDYVACWAATASSCPDVLFYAPTRSYRIPKIGRALVAAAQVKNLIIRPSADMVGDAPPNVVGLSAGTTVHRGEVAYRFECNRCHRDMKGTTGYDGACACGGLIQNRVLCPAHEQGNECGGCRACWSRPGVAISYPLH